jgi:hypothetical protein
MSSTRITYAPRPEATPEGEVSTLAHVYRFVLDARAKKEAAPISRPDDEKGWSSNDSLATTNCTR